MPIEDGWDWPWLLFTGTILLGIPEKEFWQYTPLKFTTLWDCQTEYDEMRRTPAGGKSKSKHNQANKVEDTYIDQIQGW